MDALLTVIVAQSHGFLKPQIIHMVCLTELLRISFCDKGLKWKERGPCG